MASATTIGSSGYIYYNKDVSDFQIINNSLYTYFVHYVLPISTWPAEPGAGDVVATSVKIFYEPSCISYLPLVRK